MKRVIALLVPLVAAFLTVLLLSRPGHTQGQVAPAITGAEGSGGLVKTGQRLGLRKDCGTGSGVAWDGDSWECAASGGGISDGDKGDVVVSSTGTVWTVDTGAVSLSKMASLATARFLGRTTAGTGVPEALTGTQATAMLDVGTSSTKGLVPASGGGTTNFYRADGTFAAPPGGGGGAVTQSITGSTGSVNALAVGSTTTILYWTQSGTVALNGITNGAAGRAFDMVLNSTQLLGLQVENAGATATDRIMAPGGADQTFQGPTVIRWNYDTTNNRWTYGPITKYMASLQVAGASTLGAGATITTGGLTVTAGGISVTSGNVVVQQSLTVNDVTTLGNAAGDLTNLIGELAIADGTGKMSTKASATSVSLSVCGTGPTIVGDRNAGTVTTGTGATSCNINFVNNFTSAPTCVLSTRSSTKTYSNSVSVSQLSIAGAAAAQIFDYHCVDHF